MTTVTVEIDKAKDLSAIKEFITTLGLKYNVIDGTALVYTEELKNMLDERYNSYREGKAELVSAEESQRKINQLLAVKSE